MLTTVSGVYANGQIPTFNSQPTLAELQTSPVYIKISTRNFNSYFAVTNSTDVDYFYALVNTAPTVYVVSKTNQNFNIFRLTSAGTVYTDASIKINNSYNIYGYEYSYSGTVEESTIPFLGTFSNLAGVFDYYLANGVTYPVTPVSTQGYTTIEAGNIVYFDLGTNKSYDLSMQSAFYSYSGVLSGTWPDDNRRYGFVDELPTANTNLAESAGTSILWSDDTDGQTILGTNNKGVATISGTTTGRYMWVINPLYNNKYYDDALNAKAINGVMKVYGVPAGTTVYTYKLKQNATSLGLDNVIPSVSGGVGTVSENEGQETPFTSTDDNETPYTQTVGGDTSAPETVTAIEGVRQTLQQFVDMFLNLLTAPADYIQQLISAGSAFMQAISGIFTWLPSPVVDVFISALILMIVIGVLKMLL